MKRVLLYSAGAILIGLYFYQKREQMAGILTALIYMTLFSFSLAPFCARMERWGLRPTYAAGCAVIGLFLLLLVLIAAFIPYLIVQSEYLVKRISPAASELMETLLAWKDRSGFMQASLAETGSMLGAAIGSLTGRMFRGGMNAAKQIGRMGFALILTYYVLCDRRRIGCHLLLVVPMRWRKTMLSALHACRNAMMGYLCGMIKTSAFVTAATGIGLMLIGVQDAVLLALLMGILEILPYIGPILAAIPILLSALMQGTETALLALAMLILVQLAEGNFISPYFTASSTSVHPFAAILAVFVMGSLAGVWGIMAAVPLLVLIRSVLWSFGQARFELKAAGWTSKKFCSSDD